MVCCCFSDLSRATLVGSVAPSWVCGKGTSVLFQQQPPDLLQTQTELSVLSTSPPVYIEKHASPLHLANGLCSALQ